MSTPLRVVWAPKSQNWHISKSGWRPKHSLKRKRLRPLTHIDLEDQVVATALMLCLANRAETERGDPRFHGEDAAEHRRSVVSYGNRLYCDNIDGELCHRWGSRKLYRAYFADYRSFLRRPADVTASSPPNDDDRIFFVDSDLRQFYDRVTPNILSASLASLQRSPSEDDFFKFAEQALIWTWNTADLKEVTSYGKSAGIPCLSSVALPQSLVAAGFFANIVLLGFDKRLRASIGHQVVDGIRILDVCRYVDDIRVTVRTGTHATTGDVEREIRKWLEAQLTQTTDSLQIADEKTQIAEFEGSRNPIVRQSGRMERIQSAVSGGFDAVAGLEILDRIQGLMRTQEQLTEVTDRIQWEFAPQSDVRDGTVWRFSAARYRTTYRSTRPLLEEAESVLETSETAELEALLPSRRIARNQAELDEEARTFALGLVGRWLADPSNVRLLRIGLDIWPAPELLEEVLGRLRHFVRVGGGRGPARRVAAYCLAELFRAGATETGFVDDDEELAVDIKGYRRILGDEALRVIRLPSRSVPWHVRQQALLFAAVHRRLEALDHGAKARTPKRYWQILRFLRGDEAPATPSDFATLAVLCRRSFGWKGYTDDSFVRRLTADQKEAIATRDPSFARELGDRVDGFYREMPAGVRADLCFGSPGASEGHRRLDEVVLGSGGSNPLRNELSILRFARTMLDTIDEWRHLPIITPGQVAMEIDDTDPIPGVKAVKIDPPGLAVASSMYMPPVWCEEGDRWRLQLGFLLRFILAENPDFTARVERWRWYGPTVQYRPAGSIWYQRLYGLATTQDVVGGDWIAISEWIEGFLLTLLRWPGCRVGREFRWAMGDPRSVHIGVHERIKRLGRMRGLGSRALLLPTKIVGSDLQSSKRPFRACVVQTVIPSMEHFQSWKVDPQLSGPAIRKKHRNHVSAALEAVRRMLVLRSTHVETAEHLDLLILPELAVHPADIWTHIVPFVRQQKTIVLTGVTYDQVCLSGPLINSALWVVPDKSDEFGVQVRFRRQGKAWMAEDETFARGFRPCQWILEFVWEASSEPMKLTASVCYDATDLRLVSDLRKQSDVYIVPACNKDVGTFDKMSLALHYHMFQLVVVANNGQYGGSNAYWPRRGTHAKQIFHLHGQPQASIAFLEIEDIADFLSRGGIGGQTGEEESHRGASRWKRPPAGWDKEGGGGWKANG